MIRKGLLISLITILALLAMACVCSFAGFPSIVRTSVETSGEFTTEDRPISDEITVVEISGGGTVIFTQDDEASLELEGDSGYLSDIETIIRGNTLTIRPKTALFSGWDLDGSDVTYRLALPVLEKMTAAGALDVHLGELQAEEIAVDLSGSSDLTADKIEGETVSLTASGSSDIYIEEIECANFTATFSGSTDFNAGMITVKEQASFDSSAVFNMDIDGLSAEEVQIKASGSADMTVSLLEADSLDVETSGSANLSIEEGEVETQRIEISGSGSYDAPDLKSADAVLDGGGACTFTLWATDSLTIKTSGSADVNYYGAPEITQNTSGSTSINAMDRERDD